MTAPIAREPACAGSRPWVTCAILVACVAVFLPTQIGAHRRLEQGLATLEQALAYHRQHPYLPLDPRLESLPGPPRAAPTQAVDPQFGSLEQVELDTLTRSGFDTLARTPQYRWGLVPARPSLPGWLTHPFVHAGALHLLGNLLLLCLVGPLLEEAWGGYFFGAFYLASGAVSATVFALANPNLDAPLIGAAGALAGVLGAFTARFGRGRVHFLRGFGDGIRGTAPYPGWVVLPLWLVREALAGYPVDVVAPGGGAGVYLAHLGGFAFGVAAAAALAWAGLEGRLAGFAKGSRGRRAGASDPPSGPAEGSPSLDAPARAWDALMQAARHSPGQPEAMEALWTAAVASGRTGEAAPLLLRRIHELVQGGEGFAAFRHWRQLQGDDPGARVPLPLEIRLAEELLRDSLPQEAAEVIGVAAGRARADLSPVVLLRLARLAAGEDRARLAALVLAHPDLPPGLAAEAAGLGPPPPGPEAPPARAPAPGPARGGGAPVGVRPTAATPISLAQGALTLELVGGGRRTLSLSRVRALAAVAVEEDSVEPNFVLDLVLERPGAGAKGVRVLRLETHRFDPRALVPSEAESEDAFHSLAGAVLAASGASWLLGETDGRLRRYPSLAHYHRDLLAVLRLGLP